jgi:glutaredoxin-like protein
MPMIPAHDVPLIAQYFEQTLESPVTIHFFTQKDGAGPLPLPECLLGADMEELLREVSALSPRVRLEIHDLVAHPERAEAWGVGRLPTVILTGAARGRVRFLGLPSGYEFAALVDGLVDVARGATDLPAQAREELSGLERDVHIQVFGTPLCPQCPRAGRLAHKFAVESPRITADLIEIAEFPDLAHRYKVTGVPKIVVNEAVELFGAQTPAALLTAVRRACSA